MAVVSTFNPPALGANLSFTGVAVAVVSTFNPPALGANLSPRNNCCTQSNANKSFVAPMSSETKLRRIKTKRLSSISNSVSSIEVVNRWMDMLGS